MMNFHRNNEGLAGSLEQSEAELLTIYSSILGYPRIPHFCQLHFRKNKLQLTLITLIPESLTCNSH